MKGRNFMYEMFVYIWSIEYLKYFSPVLTLIGTLCWEHETVNPTSYNWPEVLCSLAEPAWTSIELSCSETILQLVLVASQVLSPPPISLLVQVSSLSQTWIPVISPVHRWTFFCFCSSSFSCLHSMNENIPRYQTYLVIDDRRDEQGDVYIEVMGIAIYTAWYEMMRECVKFLIEYWNSASMMIVENGKFVSLNKKWFFFICNDGISPGGTPNDMQPQNMVTRLRSSFVLLWKEPSGYTFKAP